ncbi:MAG: transporter [Candidatus Melainabacteria bacterium]|nr:transporter [Candidatus Melainabacteria bacterium]
MIRRIPLIPILILLATVMIPAARAADPDPVPDPDSKVDARPDLSPISLVRRGWKDFIRAQDYMPMICTDRNSVTPHPNVVPLGYLQFENGVTLDKFHHGGDFGGSETLARLGAWRHGELRLQAPTYLTSFGDSDAFAGVTDIQLGIKQELDPPALRKKGVDIGVIAGFSVPTGSRSLTTTRVDPFVQMISFYRYRNCTLGTSHSIFMPSQFQDDPAAGPVLRRNVTYQPTVILFKHIKVGKEQVEKIDIWTEYAGLFYDQGSSVQLIDMGAVYRPVKRHQVDFRFGFGLTGEAPRAFIGMGYSWLPGRALPFYKRPVEYRYRP